MVESYNGVLHSNEMSKLHMHTSHQWFSKQCWVKAADREFILCYSIYMIKNGQNRASLVVQWIGIYLPMQGTRVWLLILKASTRQEATKARNYWAQEPQLLEPVCSGACEPQLLSLSGATTEAHVPEPSSPTRKTAAMRSTCTCKSSPCPLQLEKDQEQQWRPSTVKIK